VVCVCGVCVCVVCVCVGGVGGVCGGGGWGGCVGGGGGGGVGRWGGGGGGGAAEARKTKEFGPLTVIYEIHSLTYCGNATKPMYILDRPTVQSQ